MKNTLVLFIILFNIFNSFSQTPEQMLDKMLEIANNKSDKEGAKNIALDLINSKYGDIDNETNFYAQYVISDFYYGKRKFKLALHYFNILLVFSEVKNIKVEGFRQYLKDIKFKIQNSKDYLSEDNSSEEAKVAEIIKNKNHGKPSDLEKNQIVTINTNNKIDSNSANQTSSTSVNTPKTNDDKTVTLTVSGTGKTLEEAKTNALRSAIEQAFGAFISSKTEILNDNLVKDEIVSVANGNVQKYDIVSQVEIPNSGYAMTLNATVSITNLTSFAESKGVAIEFKGGLFAQNIKLQKLNEEAEEKATKNLIEVYIQLLENSFDFNLESTEPVMVPGKSDTYKIIFKVTTIENKNYNNFIKFFKETLSNVQANEEEFLNIQKVGKPIYTLVVDSKEYKFRSINAFRNISKFFISSQLLSSAFKIESNIDLYKYDFINLFRLNKWPHDEKWVLLNSKARTFNTVPNEKFLSLLFPFYLEEIQYKSLSDFYKIDICPIKDYGNREEDKYIREKFYRGYGIKYVRKINQLDVDIDNILYFKTVFNAPIYNYEINLKLSELELINEFKVVKIPFLEYINNLSKYVELEK